MSTSKAARPLPDGPKIIHASLFRMGTKSLAQAYTVLGFTAHHGAITKTEETPWHLIEASAEAKWPSVPGAPSKPRPSLTPADLKALWGPWDVATDIASPFVPDMIAAFPDVKVVVVQRDFEKWWKSMESNIIDRVFGEPLASILTFITHHLMGLRAIPAMQKLLYGFFNAKTKAEVKAHARETYDEYFHEVRRLAGPERRLEFKTEDGWGPLCEFLGVDVPVGIPFPTGNESATMRAHQDSQIKEILMMGVKVAGGVVVGVAAIYLYWQRA